MNKLALSFVTVFLIGCGSDNLPVQSHIARTDGIMRMMTVRAAHLIDLVNERRSHPSDLKYKLNSYSQHADDHESARIWLQATPVPPASAEYHKALVSALDSMVELRSMFEELDGMLLMQATETGVPSEERRTELLGRAREAVDHMKQQIEQAFKQREALVKQHKIPVGNDGAAIKPKDKPYEYYDFQY